MKQEECRHVKAQRHMKRVIQQLLDSCKILNLEVESRLGYDENKESGWLSARPLGTFKATIVFNKEEVTQIEEDL